MRAARLTRRPGSFFAGVFRAGEIALQTVWRALGVHSLRTLGCTCKPVESLSPNSLRCSILLPSLSRSRSLWRFLYLMASYPTGSDPVGSVQFQFQKINWMKPLDTQALVHRRPPGKHLLRARFGFAVAKNGVQLPITVRHRTGSAERLLANPPCVYDYGCRCFPHKA